MSACHSGDHRTLLASRIAGQRSGAGRGGGVFDTAYTWTPRVPSAVGCKSLEKGVSGVLLPPVSRGRGPDRLLACQSPRTHLWP